MKYPAYPQYKDSGVAWLGEVPTDWDVKGLRYVCRLAYGDSLAAENREDGEIAVYGSNGQVGSHIVSNTKSPVIVVGRKGSFGKINYSDQPVFAIDTTYYIDNSCTSYSLNWLKYALLVLRLDENSKDSAVPGLAREDAYSSKLPVPPYLEQTAIADFLDRETGRIDTLVAKKRKLVELLKEKRSALISRTVTRGLPTDAAREFGLATGNSAVHEAPANYGRGDFTRPQTEANKFAPTSDPASSKAFKDSGVEWLGEIPANWETPPLYSRYSIELGKMLNESRITGRHLLPYLRNVDVQWDSINFIDLPEMDIPEQEYSRYTVQEGDLLVCEGGEVGRSAIVGELQANIGFQKALHRMRALNSLMEFPRYMYYVMYWASKTGVFNSGGISTIAHLTGEQLRKYRFPKPSFQEQTAIATYLDRETAKIDRLVAKVETAITRLQEYRSALITAAVTGKIDVRGAVQ